MSEGRYKSVDEFIDYGDRGSEEEHERYARWVLDYFRMSAIRFNDFAEFMGDRLLFCEYGGKVYRVTGASRLGDVWITGDYAQSSGYQQRVDINDLSKWSPTL